MSGLFLSNKDLNLFNLIVNWKRDSEVKRTVFFFGMPRAIINPIPFVLKYLPNF